jgi:ATP-dependent Clp protease, protease subunit
MSEQKNNQTNKRNFILDGKVDEESIRNIVEKIIDINLEDEGNREPKPINIIINTYGGSLYEANLMIGVIETSRTPIHTYCYGKAMSAGFYIFSAGHKRFATPLATFMYHDASVGIHNSIEGLKKDIEWQERLRNQYDAYMLSVTNLPKHIMDYKKERQQDWYLTAEEAFGYGLVDEIISFRKSIK